VPLARLHHYVPRCYLKGFARNRNKNSKLFVIDAKVRRSFESTPRNLAAERDFNRIDASGIAPDVIENQLAPFEAKLDKALERIIELRSFDDQSDRTIVINLIALLAIRNPRLRENMRRAQEQSARVVMELVLSSRERWEAHMRQMHDAGYPEAGIGVSYEEMKAFNESDKYRLEMNQTRHIAREFLVAQEVLPLLMQRKWSLLRAAPNSGGIITSDHPVCLMWANPRERHGFYGPGLGTVATELLFPISKDLALFSRFEGDECAYDASDYQVAAFNGAIACFAERQVFAENDRFVYVMREGVAPRRGSQLLNEPGFTRP
jgi:hypothetical protein